MQRVRESRVKNHVVVLLLMLLTGCASVPTQTPSDLVGHKERGKASFYAMKYQFRQTASGERFNQLSKTAAHRTLPFGTRVKVTNLASGKSVIVKINDRGPFIQGRVIDLTRSAFSSIGSIQSGLIDVEIEVVR